MNSSWFLISWSDGRINNVGSSPLDIECIAAMATEEAVFLLQGSNKIVI